MKTNCRIRLIRKDYRYIGKRHIFCWFVMMIIMIISFMFQVESWVNEDYVRHIHLIEEARRTDKSFWEFLLNPSDGTSLTYGYKSLFAYNILRYLVANLFENNYVLSWICVFITYSFICSIALDWKKGKKYLSIMEVIFNFLLCFALLPYFQVCSGLRTAVAASLVCYAIYGYLYKEKSLLFYVIWTLLACAFHTFVLLTVPFVFLAKLDFGIKTYGIIILAFMSLKSIAQIFYKSNINFLRSIAVKFMGATSENQYRSWRFCYYGVLLICVAIIMYHLLCNYLGKNKFMLARSSNVQKDTLYRFITYYACFVIGTFYSYSLVVRQGYILGVLAPILATFFFEKGKNLGIRKAILQGIRICISLVTLFVCYRYIVIYHIYYI